MRIPLIGVSASIKKTKDLIKHVADSGLNIIITGESGVGKEVVAQNLYYDSPRNGKPFIKVNCAALPDGLLESELFGYEPGAFTGAQKKKRGKFEMANKGIMFLDEIGDMSISLQAKILHVLQSGEFARLGSENELKTDTWIIAATNRELDEDIKNGTFRKDLYYRLNTITIHILPLRERPEDIPLLIDYYINLYNAQFKRKPVFKPDKHLLKKLLEHHWPGNVRELQNVLKRLMVLGDLEEIGSEFTSKKASFENKSPHRLPQEEPHQESLNRFGAGGKEPIDFTSFSLKEVKKQAADIAEKEAISFVLAKTEWNRTKAARILKISYKTLLYKISDLEIKPS